MLKAPLLSESSALYVSRDATGRKTMKLSGIDCIALGKMSRKTSRAMGALVVLSVGTFGEHQWYSCCFVYWENKIAIEK